MKIKKIIILFLFYIVFIFITPAFAQISKLLFLHQVIRSGLENNSELQATRSRLNITKAEILSASVLENPFFTFDSNLVEKSYEFGLQRIFTLGRLEQKRKNIASQRHEIEGKILEIKEFELKNKLRAAYIRHYVNKKKLKAFGKLYNQVETILDRDKHKNRDKYKEKNNCKEKAVRFQGEIVLLEIEHILDKTKLAIKKSDMILEKLIGKSIIEDDLILHPPDRIPASLKPFINKNSSNIMCIPDKYIKDYALKERYELKEIQESIKLAERQKELVLAERWPLLLLEAGATINFDYNKSRPFFSANIEIPVLDRESEDITVADEREKHHKKRLEILKKRIEIEVKDAYQTFKHSKERFDNYDSYIMPETEKHAENLTESYYNKHISLKDIIDVKKSVLEIKNTYFEALIDYQKSIIELDKAVGVFEIGSQPGSILSRSIPVPGRY